MTTFLESKNSNEINLNEILKKIISPPTSKSKFNSEIFNNIDNYLICAMYWYEIKKKMFANLYK